MILSDTSKIETRYSTLSDNTAKNGAGVFIDKTNITLFGPGISLTHNV